MGLKTQYRLSQMTGSFGVAGDGDGHIIDGRSAQSGALSAGTQSLASGSMVGVMSEIASAIRRMHGGNSFMSQNEGVYVPSTFTVDTTGLISLDNTTTTGQSNFKSAAGSLLIESGKTGANALILSASHTAGGALIAVGSAGLQIDGPNYSDLLNLDSNSADFHENVVINVNNATDASSSTSGALIVDGGVGVAKALEAGTTIKSGTTITAGTDVTVTGGDVTLGADGSATAGTVKASGQSSSGVDGQTLLVAGGDYSGSTSSRAGGATTVRGGNASNSSASQTGGALNLLGGTSAHSQSGTTGGDVVITPGKGASAGDFIVKTYADGGGSSLAALTIAAGGASTFASNVTITGNLDVNGTTTTIDTTNMSIKDSIIALGVSGSTGGYSTTGDRGILFTRGTAGQDNQSGLWYNGTRYQLATSATDATSGSFGTPTSYDTLMIGKLELDGTGVHLDTDGSSNLTITANNTTIDSGGDVIVDAGGDDIYFKANGSEKLYINQAETGGPSLRTSGSLDLQFGIDGGKGNANIAQSYTEIFRLDTSSESLLVASGKELQFADDGEHISGDGSTLTVKSELGIVKLESDAVAKGQSSGVELGDDVKGTHVLSDGTTLNGSSSTLPFAGSSQSAAFATAFSGKTLRISDASGSIDVVVGSASGSNVSISSVELVGSASSVATTDVMDNGTIKVLLTRSSPTVVLDSANSINIKGASNEDYVYFENSPLKLEQILEPTSVTDKLYNVGGVLYWNGAPIARAPSVYRKVITNAAYEIPGTIITFSAAETTDEGGDSDVTWTYNTDVNKVQVYVNGQLMYMDNNAVHSDGMAFDGTFGSSSPGTARSIYLDRAIFADDVIQVVVFN